MQAIITGLVLGGVYALVATGLTLTWSAVGFFNLSHGALMTATGYITYSIQTALDASSSLLTIPIAVAAGSILGAVSWLILVRPFSGHAQWSVRALVASLALAALVQSLLFAVYGGTERLLPGSLEEETVIIFGAQTTAEALMMVIVSLGTLMIMYGVLKFTRIGLAVRAIAQNPMGASIIGINPRLMSLAVMSLAGSLGGLAGVLLADFYFLAPSSGQAPLLSAMIVVILGGMGSIGGTILAALLFGGVESAVATWFGSQWVVPSFFLALALMLTVRPQGLGGVLEDTHV